MMNRIIAKNFGATHVVEDRQASHDQDRRLSQINVEIAELDDLEYDPESSEYRPSPHSEFGQEFFKLSDDTLNRMISNGETVPDWAVFPDVIDLLRQQHRPRSQQGVTVFFTGLPSSGKSTLAMLLTQKLNEIGDRPITLLDGDLVRRNLSSELGFSKEHRDINIRRIGYVASEITKNGGFAICAPIAPFASTRAAVRDMISPLGGFIEVFVSTPVEVCEQRDVKGLYALAKAGKLSDFTGVNDPYESPRTPELSIDTSKISATAGVDLILAHMENAGYLQSD
jgi:sulfate adenylyltransferase